MKRNPLHIIKGAIVTEKTTLIRTLNNWYTFKVSKDANKEEIKQAIEKLFNVKVERVNTVNYKGKKKRLGRFIGRTSGYKKAYVKLKEGYVISQFEGT